MFCFVAAGGQLVVSQQQSTGRADCFALLIFTSSPPSGRVIERGMKPPTVDQFIALN